MAASANDAHPYPIYNARYRVTFPILDADGDLVTAATGLDSELSQDQGTFADATNEATEIATSSGVYYLDLIATELDTKQTAVIVKTTTSGAKTTPMVLYPTRLPVIRTGTAQAGAASTVTLDSGASAKDDAYNGCYVNITNDSPAGARGQARRIVDYVGSTKVATIEGTWGTNPSSASTFEILLTAEACGVAAWQGTHPVDANTVGVPRVDVDLIEGVNVSTSTAQLGVNVVNWNGSAVASPAVAGVPKVDVTHWIGTAAATPTVAGVPEVDVTHLGGTAGTFASGRPEVNTTHAAGTAVQAASGRFQVDVELWNGTAVPAEHTAGYPIVTVKDGTGTGEINTNAGAVALVDLVTTLTTYTGNTPQTGDVFPLASTEIADIKAKTDNLPSDPADQSLIIAATDAIMTRLGAPAGASVSADIAAIEAQTDDIGAAGAGLTAVPWNAAWDAEVQSEVDDALIARSLDRLVTVSGTADSGTTTTMVDAARTEGDADYWKGSILLFTSGTISGQARIVTDFNAGTDTFTFAPPTTQAVGTQTYVILPAVSVWDDVLAEHLTSGSTGAALNAAGAAGDPWSTALPGAYGPGTAGKIIGDNVDATVSSRASQASVDTIDDFLDTEVAAIKAKTDNLPTDPADASDIAASFAALPSAAGIADAVWDELRADHIVAGSFGEYALAVLADNVTHGGTAANLALRSLSVVFTGKNGDAVTFTGVGTGHGLVVTGGTSGTGIVASGRSGVSMSGIAGAGLDVSSSSFDGVTISGANGTRAAVVLTSSAGTAGIVGGVDNVLGKVLGGGAEAITGTGVQAQLPADAIGSDQLAATGTAEIADRVLGRNLAGGSDGGRTVTDALRASRNKVALDVPGAGQFTVFAEDDVTPAWIGTYTRSGTAVNALTAMDPS
jgi:hypothetical protein